MTDYDKMTVANLRVLLKDRGIPSTGLTRKAQIIAKLQEEDAAAATTVGVAPAEEEPVAGTLPEQDIPAMEKTLESEPVANQIPNAPVTETLEQEEASAVEKTSASNHASDHNPDAPVTEELPAAKELSPEKEVAENPKTTINGLHATEPHAEKNGVKTSTVNREHKSATPFDTKSTSANRSLSQTPLPSKEEAISQPVQTASINTTPAPSREDTVATTQTDTDERKKRKRRSESPPIDTQEVLIKRAKVAEEVHLKEDEEILPSQTTQEDVTMSDDAPIERISHREEAGRDQGVEGKDMVPQSTSASSVEKDIISANSVTESSNSKAADLPASKPEIRRTKDIRHQHILPAERPHLQVPEPVQVEDLPTPSPSSHTATRALYIRNFMRPLQLPALKTHLAALAGASDVDVIEKIFVDSIKTHAFVQLTSLAAAARVRAGMHNQVWPKERDRKPLWVDYIPEESVQIWIDTEENAGSALGSRVGGRKWEVVYEHDGDTVVAHHVEVGSGTQSREPARPIPTGPSQGSQASISQAPVISKPPQPEQIAQTFVALDELFNSTKAKPMLYFKPVGAKVADDRLDDLDYYTGKYWSTRDQRDDDELMRYTFDDEKLVETGVHHNKGRGGFGPGRGGRGGPSSRFGRGAPRGPSRGNWYR